MAVYITSSQACYRPQFGKFRCVSKCFDERTVFCLPSAGKLANHHCWLNFRQRTDSERSWFDLLWDFLLSSREGNYANRSRIVSPTFRLRTIENEKCKQKRKITESSHFQSKYWWRMMNPKAQSVVAKSLSSAVNIFMLIRLSWRFCAKKSRCWSKCVTKLFILIYLLEPRLSLLGKRYANGSLESSAVIWHILRRSAKKFLFERNAGCFRGKISQDREAFRFFFFWRHHGEATKKKQRRK